MSTTSYSTGVLSILLDGTASAKQLAEALLSGYAYSIMEEDLLDESVKRTPEEAAAHASLQFQHHADRAMQHIGNHLRDPEKNNVASNADYQNRIRWMHSLADPNDPNKHPGLMTKFHEHPIMRAHEYMLATAGKKDKNGDALPTKPGQGSLMSHPNHPLRMLMLTANRRKSAIAGLDPVQHYNQWASQTGAKPISPKPAPAPTAPAAGPANVPSAPAKPQATRSNKATASAYDSSTPHVQAAQTHAQAAAAASTPAVAAAHAAAASANAHAASHAAAPTPTPTPTGNSFPPVDPIKHVDRDVYATKVSQTADDTHPDYKAAADEYDRQMAAKDAAMRAEKALAPTVIQQPKANAAPAMPSSDPHAGDPALDPILAGVRLSAHVAAAGNNSLNVHKNMARIRDEIISKGSSPDEAKGLEAAKFIKQQDEYTKLMDAARAKHAGNSGGTPSSSGGEAPEMHPFGKAWYDGGGDTPTVGSKGPGFNLKNVRKGVGSSTKYTRGNSPLAATRWDKIHTALRMFLRRKHGNLMPGDIKKQYAAKPKTPTVGGSSKINLGPVTHKTKGDNTGSNSFWNMKP